MTVSRLFDTLPADVFQFMDWTWEQIEPFLTELEAREINQANVVEWLNDWSRLGMLLQETYSRLYVATTINTADEAAQRKFFAYIENIVPNSRAANNKLERKLIASGLQPSGYEIPLRNMRVSAELFREENLPLFTEEEKLSNEYDQIVGAQTITYNGEELTIPQTLPYMQNPDRAVREAVWRAASDRQLADKSKLNELWQKFLKLRIQISENCDLPDYRAYQWRNFNRFDYSPDDCLAFHRAIEQVVVPAAKRIYDRRRERMGLDTLRPWDKDVDPLNREPLKPFAASDVDSLINKSFDVFNKVDPVLGDYYDTMRRENLLDLDNRKNKAPGGYCTDFPASKRPFIFMNAVGIHDDVQTLLHEGGHAFHAFESSKLPPYLQTSIPIEMCEVASMSMELLAAPYLTTNHGGFYTEADAARARIDHLERNILFWPYMAVVDAFQHWVYTHPNDAMNPDNCDQTWSELWDRFMVGIDYTGLEDAKADGWHRKLHIFQIPFYYVDYGLAQLGAVQVWRNSLKDQAGAIAQYRSALALGGTKPLPELFAAAGAKFAWDAETLGEAVDLMERTIHQLEN